MNNRQYFPDFSGNIYNATASTGTGQIIDPAYPYTVPQELPNAPRTNVENIPGGLSYTFSNITFPYNSNPNNMFNPNQTHIVNNTIDSPAFKTYAVSPNVDPIVMIQQQIANKRLEQQQLENNLLQEKVRRNMLFNAFHNDKQTSTSDFPESARIHENVLRQSFLKSGNISPISQTNNVAVQTEKKVSFAESSDDKPSSKTKIDKNV